MYASHFRICSAHTSSSGGVHEDCIYPDAVASRGVVFFFFPALRFGLLVAARCMWLRKVEEADVSLLRRLRIAVVGICFAIPYPLRIPMIAPP